MNILYEDLPTAVSVRGETYEVLTDFRDWIRFSDLVSDSRIDDSEKIGIMSEWYVCGCPCTVKDMIDGLIKFFSSGGEDSDQEDTEAEETDSPADEPKNMRQLYSYSEDAAYIIGGFLECYGIDLLEIPYMHWWKFKSLLNAMSEETEFKKRIQYRSIDASKIKDSSERRRIQRIQANIALKKGVVSDCDIASALDVLM